MKQQWMTYSFDLSSSLQIEFQNIGWGKFNLKIWIISKVVIAIKKLF